MKAYPRVLGQYQDKDVILKKSSYGLYIEYNKESYSLKDKKVPSLEEAIAIIKEKQQNILESYVVTVDGKKIKVVALNGQYGPYIKFEQNKKTRFVSIPKDLDPKELTDEQIIT